MVELLGVIKSYLDNQLPEKDGKYLIGKLIERGQLEENIDKHILLETKEHLPGEIIKKIDSNSYELAFPGKEENFRYIISSEKIELNITPPQVTKEEPEIRQAVKKEDWEHKEPYKILIKGDYSQHITIIKKAIDLFYNNKKVELWLPSLIP